MKQPSGIVTFLFTDIEGSTKLAQQFPEKLQFALHKHHLIVQSAIESNKGYIFEIIGDAFCSAFENAEDAITSAIEAQRNLSGENWNDAVIKVRMGIHSGDAEWNDDTYVGYITLARTKRIMSAAYGEQILLSKDTHDLLNSRHTGFQNQIFTFRDLGERKLKDIIEPIKLFQIIAPGLREDFLPLKTLDARPNNLPVQLTSFIGREEEIKHVKEMLKQTHMLTLTGTGGSGKTRLSLQIAADVIDEFENGVWFTELASLSDPSFLSQTVLKVFGLKEEKMKSPEETLLDYLRQKNILIVLDNCEHLVEYCAKLVEKLLQKCPQLKIIATSREALHCSGENIHRVLSLKAPDPKGDVSVKALNQYESVRLFVERALSVNANFTLNTENASALAEICYRLDGIPLAIELAAARIKILSPEKIFEKLKDKFNLLKEGKRTALPRQQTLRALLDWSYDLLSEKEKLLWQRLSVFTDGWTLEAAEEICSDEKLNKDEIFELLNHLIEKSIIIADTKNDRYRILETLKEYAIERLNKINTSEGILNAHLEYYLGFAEDSAIKLNEGDVLCWLEKIESDHNNLQSAIEWSVKNNLEESGARVAIALSNFWIKRAYFSTGIRMLNIILDHQQNISKITLAKVLNSNGVLTSNLGEKEKGRKFFERSLELRRETGDKRGIAVTLGGLGGDTLLQGDYLKAKIFFEEGLAIAQEIEDKNLICNALHNLGVVHHFLNNFELSQDHFEKSLKLRRDMNNKFDTAKTLSNIGSLATDQKNFEKAERFLKESLELKKELGDRHGEAFTLIHLGILEYDLENFEMALKYYHDALDLKIMIGEKPGIVEVLTSLGNTLLRQKNYDEAKKYLFEAVDLIREIGDNVGNEEVIIGFANILSGKNDLINSARLLGAVRQSFESANVRVHRIVKENFYKTIKQVKEKSGQKEFAKYFDEGKLLSSQQAIEIAVPLLV